MSLEKLYSSREVAEYLKVTPETVWNWIKAGRLKASKVGRSYKIREVDLREFIGQKYEVEISADAT